MDQHDHARRLDDRRTGARPSVRQSPLAHTAALTRSVPPDAAAQSSYVTGTSKWVGTLRFRQLRVRPGGNCEITPDLNAGGCEDGRMGAHTHTHAHTHMHTEWQHQREELGLDDNRQIIAACYGPYSEEERSEASYGPTPRLDGFEFVDIEDQSTWSRVSVCWGGGRWHTRTHTHPSQIPFLATSGAEYTASSVIGDVATYDESGFVVEISRNATREQFETAINELKVRLRVRVRGQPRASPAAPRTGQQLDRHPDTRGDRDDADVQRATQLLRIRSAGGHASDAARAR